MKETDGLLRHLAFFEELGKMDRDDPNWRSVSAGLLVMRLIDSWIADGATPARVDSWGVSAVRETIAELSGAKPLRGILTSIVDVVVASVSVDLHALSPRLMAYGQALEYDSHLSIAVDVYRTIIAHAHRTDDIDLIIAAHRQTAVCLRNLGELDSASAAYELSGELAKRINDNSGILRAQIGHAKIAFARGNLPKADSILETIVIGAEREELSNIRSMALHDRAQVAIIRKDYERGISFAYEALKYSATPTARDRLLNDMATCFRLLGKLDVARDAYEVVAASAMQQYVRWVSELNLMEIAAQAGDELRFDRYRRALSSADFTPELRITYLIYLGRGYHNLGQSDAGIGYLNRAIEIASEYKFNQLLFEAEGDLAEARRSMVPKKPDTVFELSEETRDVIEIIQGMRQQVCMA